jgi:hypothetical protein
MSDYALISGVYATVTPAGAYYAVTGAEEDPARNLLAALLAMPQTPLLDLASLKNLHQEEDEAGALELLFRMQKIGWIEGKNVSRDAPELNMEREVPQLLGRLSGEGRAMLADAEGFYLANAGFAHEAVEGLSVLAADIATVQQRHTLLLRHNLRCHATGWAAVDGAGNSQIGFWPLQISQHIFVLAIAGETAFNQPAFADLIWWLVRRYATG